MNPKIAVIKKDFRVRGGLEKIARAVLATLVEVGAQPSLFTTTYQTDLPYRQEVCTSASWFRHQQLRRFDTWVAECTSRGKFDVVFSMDRCSYQTHHRAGNGVHRAYLDLRGITPRTPFQIETLRLERCTFESPTVRTIIANSFLVKQQILHYYNTPQDRIHVVHNGAPWHELKEPFESSFTQKEAVLASLGLRSSCFHFLFVGHNFQRKGVDALLKAAAKLPRDDFHISIVGHDRRQRKYEKLASKLGLRSNVTFFQEQSPLPFYQVADALVLPSLYDPCANVTVEALAMGLWVITTATNGASEIVTPGSGYILESPDTIEELTHALKEALQRPKNHATATAIRATVSHLESRDQLDKICRLCLA